MKKHKAIVNYYARLVHKGSYKLDEVPEDIRDEVNNRIKELPPVTIDPETKTAQI